MPLRIEPVRPDSPELDEVIALWRENRAALGFFPRGAFEYHAVRGWILGASNPSGSILGYLLFRVTTRNTIWPVAVVVHLCVASDSRASGVGRALVDALRDDPNLRLLRIELRCRRDYAADAIWPRYGFVYSGESPGRAGSPIARWQMPLQELPLLALLTHAPPQHPVTAVLDANVFFRIQDPTPTGPRASTLLSEEAKALTADWISEELELLVTDELFNEISRNKDPRERRSRILFGRGFRRLSPNANEVRSTQRNLRRILGVPKRSRDADLRQLANAIASGEHLFVSQDRRLVKKSDKVYSSFGLEIVTPGEMISRIDELARVSEYAPVGIAGSTSMTASRLTSGELAEASQAFLSREPGDRRAQLEAEIRALMANPEHSALVAFGQPSTSSQYVLLGIDQSTASVTRAPILRTSTHPLAPTVLRYVIRWLLLRSLSPGLHLTAIEDRHLSEQGAHALAEFGFTQTDGPWLKCSIQGLESFHDTETMLRSAAEQQLAYRPFFNALAQFVRSASIDNDPLVHAHLENALWPLKISDAAIPSYVIPIKPMWAQHLFDESLARQTLWGSSEDVALLHENVYFRSRSSPWPMLAPGRILWYVSRQEGYSGTMHLRASSSINEVVIAPAGEIYKRFRRLGIYSWKDIVRTAGSPSADLMAIRFSGTELLPSPVPLRQLRSVFVETEGKALLLQSPVRISPATFARLYRLGTAP